LAFYICASLYSVSAIIFFKIFEKTEREASMKKANNVEKTKFS
jgi:hypothetical protein